MKSSDLPATPVAKVDKIHLDHGGSESVVATTITTGQDEAAAVIPAFVI